MTPQQIIYQLEPEPEPCQSCTESSQKPLLQPKDSFEFHRFSSLPRELQDAIWQLALPEQLPLQIAIKVQDQHKDIYIWGVGPFAMLKACQGSREVALSFYEPRLKLYTIQQNPAQVFCSIHNNLLLPTFSPECSGLAGQRHIYIYSRREYPAIDLALALAVQFVLAWTIVPSGFTTFTEPEGFIYIACADNWPPPDESPFVQRIPTKPSPQSLARGPPLALEDFPPLALEDRRLRLALKKVVQETNRKQRNHILRKRQASDLVFTSWPLSLSQNLDA